MARRATLIAQDRAVHPNLILVDAGYTLYSDRPLTKESQGALIIEAMNRMEYDAMALGEEDLYLGPDLLQQRMEEAQFPILSANLKLTGTGDLFTEPYTLVPVQDRVVGIIGVMGIPSNPVSGFSVTDPYQAVLSLLPEVTERSDLVMVLSHLGAMQNASLAALSSQINLIIGGGLGAGQQQPYHEARTGTYLAQAEFPTTGHAARFVGRWNLSLRDDGGVTSNGWEAVPLGPEFADDSDMLRLLASYLVQ